MASMSLAFAAPAGLAKDLHGLRKPFPALQQPPASESQPSTSSSAGISLAGLGASLAVARAGRRRGMRSAAHALDGRETPSPHDLLLRVAMGETGAHTPVWLMRQAGRYMKAFRQYSERYPFRQRSESPDMAIELSLQCWRQYGMDAVIMFSDILTPLPAMGIEFDVIRGRGPLVLGDLARCLQDRLAEGPKTIREVSDPDGFSHSHGFLKDILQALRGSTDGKCSLIGFVGAPWTLAAYAVEGGSTKEAAVFKKWMYEKPEVADEFLRRMTTTLSNYAIYQANCGAQCIQIFDSWAHCLTPELWARFAGPGVKQVAEALRKVHPNVPIIYFANGGSSYLKDQVDMLSSCIDVVGVDAHARLSEAARIVEGSGLVLQGNVDPYVLRYGNEAEIRQAVRASIDAAGGPGRHILNLGHGVLQGTP
eukprot:CAMPEP_0197623712 /NCGR_PEP_ID=MMETSP1338-20131121/3671_1 /TAXON_ID=43686 ORGANISM="Pelagodinium beii, Strain RCC1491" /NCGR_SAMPLE_ID=MMETSP1338 /ASSEMBLY_ACC=CAM_ASM_000754 /LENGTH=422 /DNA_ID=CAMNT_0043193771 /DNA_START=102 /DNA_END=1366 /DNA_ORIENTATION=+